MSSKPRKGNYANLEATSTLNEDADDFDLLHTPKKRNCCLAPCCCKIPRIAVFLIILLILGLSLVLGYFFGVPALIQAFVNNSNLDFSSVNIGDAQNDSFTLKASATLSNAGSFSCSVDAMNVDVFYQGAKIGSTSMPKLDIEGGSISIDIEETFTISDVSLFEAYSKELLNQNGGVVWTLKGSTTVTVFGMNFNVQFDKDISINGMGGLSNVTILSFDIPRNNPDGGVEIYLNITQYNPSIVGIEIGDFSLALQFNGSYMGQVNAKNVSLLPGSNFLELQGFLKPENLELAGIFFSQYIQGLNSSVSVHGLNASVDSPDWIKYMVSILNVNTIMQGAQNLTLMKDISIVALDMEFESDTQFFTGANTFTYFVNPFGFPLEIYEVALIMDMFYENSLIARANVPFQKVIVNSTSGLISLNFTGVPIQMEDENAFADLVNELILRPSAIIGIGVDGSARIGTAMGNLTLSGIKIHQSIVVPGMDSFHNPPIYVSNAAVTSASGTIMELSLDIIIYNPSFVSFSSPVLPVLIYANGTYLGNSSISPLKLKRNSENRLTAIGHLYQNSQNTDTINAFFSEYVKGDNSTLTVHGNPEGTSITVLKKALSNLNSNATVFGLPFGIITFIHMTVSFWDFLQGIVPTSITARNPWNAQMAITKVDVTVHTSDTLELIATLNEDISNNPIVIPPNSTYVSAPQPVKLAALSWEEVEALFGNIKVNVQGPFYITVGDGFKSILQFYQKDIPASFINSSVVEFDIKLKIL